MKDELFDGLRRSIWELQCSLGEWNCDTEAAIEISPENVPEKVDSILTNVCFQELNQKQRDAVFILMISALKFTIVAQRLEKEMLEIESEFSEKRDKVAELIPFTEEDQDRWNGK